MYTNVFQRGNCLLVRGVQNGRRYNKKVEFKPTLWIQSKRDNEKPWHTLDGSHVYPIQPGNINDCKQFLETYNDVHGFDVYQSPGNVYQFIAETYKGEINHNSSDVVVFTIDIETQTENDGFPEPSLAAEIVQLISIHDSRTNQMIMWGLLKFSDEGTDIEYRYFDNEQSLLKNFIVWWQHNCPDVVTGWNSSLFDITYLYNRMCKVLDEGMANRLSPWGHVNQKEIDLNGRISTKTMITGVAQLDYLDLYKKFGTYSAKESYKLDFIAFEELGERKLENPTGTDQFKAFYSGVFDVNNVPDDDAHEIEKKGYLRTQMKSKLHQHNDETLLAAYNKLDQEIKRECASTFCRYNARDVDLVVKLDNKMKLIDLALTLAYTAKVNYEDVFSQVKTWDVIIYNFLNDRNIVVPIKKHNHKDHQYEGAYVKDPITGKHHWCCSFDLNSMYPMLMIQYNMSPETISDLKLDISVNSLLEKQADLSEAEDKEYAVAASGWCFKKDRKGMMPTLAQHYYDERVVSKKQMIIEKQQLQLIKAEMKKRGLV